jgi:UDP-galactopyranose mutase
VSCRPRFNDRFQGIPIGGYTALFERLLQGITVHTGVDFLQDRDDWLRRYDHVIYSGPIDAFFGYDQGTLEYRSLRFERELVNEPDVQGNAVVNYTDPDVPYTRILEHKHFDLSSRASQSLITREYPADWKPGQTEFYPVGSQASQDLYRRYRARADELADQVTFGGRLGEYQYYDMHQVIASALKQSRRLLSGALQPGLQPACTAALA